MELHLDEQEAALLYREIGHRFEELRREVRHTKDSQSKAYLKHKESLLRGILEKFPSDPR